MTCDAFSGLGDTYIVDGISPNNVLTASLVTRTQSLLLNSRPMTGPHYYGNGVRYYRPKALWSANMKMSQEKSKTVPMQICF